MQESKRQFSLAYLLLEIFWVGAALGLFRLAAADYHINPLILLPAIVATGAAIGGLFKRMADGAAWAVVVAIVVGMLMPAVMASQQ
jgi:hypothetical protein